MGRKLDSRSLITFAVNFAKVIQIILYNNVWDEKIFKKRL
jgi:hypothetical protein